MISLLGDTVGWFGTLSGETVKMACYLKLKKSVYFWNFPLKIFGLKLTVTIKAKLWLNGWGKCAKYSGSICWVKKSGHTEWTLHWIVSLM